MAGIFRTDVVRRTAPDLASLFQLGGAAGAIDPQARILWVDSNNGSANTDGLMGQKKAFATVAQALTEIDNYSSTTDRTNIAVRAGNYIVVAPGHTESVSAAAGWSIDQTATRIIGLGTGGRRPVITLDTATSATIFVDAADCSIEGLDIVAGLPTATGTLAKVIDVDDAGLRLTVRNCNFYKSGTADDPTAWFTFHASATYPLFEGCYLENTTTPRYNFLRPDNEPSWNYFPQLIDYTVSGTNENTTHELLTVTGDIELLVAPSIVDEITGVTGMSFGEETVATSFIAATLQAELDSNEYWTATSSLPTNPSWSDFVRKVIRNSKDFGYDCNGAATGGDIDWHMYWRPAFAENNQTFVNPGALGAL